MDNDQIFGICTLTKFSYKGVLTHSESQTIYNIVLYFKQISMRVLYYKL